jgi:hypothetical protein
MWWKLIALTSALAMLTGCPAGDDGGEATDPVSTGVGPATAPPPPPPSTPTPAPIDEGCTRFEPHRLQVVLTSAPNQPITSDIVPCTGGGRLMTLHNTGPAVWRISPPEAVLPPKEAEVAQIFRAAIPGSAALLLPGQTALLIKPSTGSVTWTPDFALSGSWLVHKHAYDLINQYRDKRVLDAFQEGSPRRRALVTCVKAGYSTYTGMTQPPSDKVNALLAGWGLGAAYGQCASQWRYADAVDTRDSIAHASWEREVAYWAQDAKWHARASTAVDALEQFRGLYRAFHP